MKIYLFILFLFTSLSLVESIYIYIEPKEKKCITDYRLANFSVDIIYYVSGREEENNIATIEDKNGNIVSSVKNKKNHKFTYLPKTNGNFKFCLENLSNSIIILTFEFDYGTNDSIISIHTIENFVQSIDNLEKKLKKLQFNIRNSAVRKRTHFNIANSIRKKINIYAFLKIGFLIIFSIFQLMMITSIFSNVKILKQINVNSEKRPLKSGTSEFL